MSSWAYLTANPGDSDLWGPGLDVRPVAEAGVGGQGRRGKKAPECCGWKGEALGCITEPAFRMSEWE